MPAIYKKELKGYLTSMLGYLFIFFILLLAGIYFTAYNLVSAYPKFEAVLSAVTFVFLVAVPILTMKIMAEERKQKTDQMLLTAPVSVGSIVWGKYLALITVYLIPVLILSFYPLIMSKYGDISYAAAYTGILGFYLLGCAYLAIGVFLSSVTESQVIAAVLTFVVLFLFYVMDGISSFFSQKAFVSFLAFSVLLIAAAFIIYGMIKNGFLAVTIGLIGEVVLLCIYFVKSSIFEGAIQRFLSIFDINSHYSNFSNGILDITGIIYFVSIILICIFLTIQSVVKRRWN